MFEEHSNNKVNKIENNTQIYNNNKNNNKYNNMNNGRNYIGKGKKNFYGKKYKKNKDKKNYYNNMNYNNNNIKNQNNNININNEYMIYNKNISDNSYDDSKINFSLTNNSTVDTLNNKYNMNYDYDNNIIYQYNNMIYHNNNNINKIQRNYQNQYIKKNNGYNNNIYNHMNNYNNQNYNHQNNNIIDNYVESNINNKFNINNSFDSINNFYNINNNNFILDKNKIINNNNGIYKNSININHIQKKNSSNKSKNVIISNNNSTSNLNKKSKNINIIINDELKKYIYKGKSAPKDKSNINKKKLFLINYGNKIKSKHILQKENIKNSIPKPVSSNLELKLSKIQDDKLYNTELLKHAEFRANTSSTNFKEDDNDNAKSIINKSTNKQLIENNYIDNALINIRGMSVPGKDTQNQIRLNQDSYIIKRDINNIKNFNIFGIFDGHGFYGHTISVYIKENLIKKIMEHPKIKLLNNLEYIYNQFKKNNFKIIKDIFNEIDYQLLNTKNEFDIKLSGSTCNILIQIGDNIICANTGDSRSILIYENNNKIKKSDRNIYNNFQVFPLSYDCKPSVPKEKERILKKGGIITKIKDSFQNEIGPLRVFMKGSLLPGLAMSRSFGDKIGKDIGIISEPLINEYILNKDVKYIIMGSDGIWEFLSNEQVMNIGNKYYINNDPDNFCRQLIKKSTELWENNSRNIDDITLIVIFFTFL